MLVMISSLKNPKLKQLQKLRERKGRRQSGCFLVEGAREVERAFLGGFSVVELYVCQKLMCSTASALLSKTTLEPHQVEEKVFEKLVVRSSAGGIIGVFRQKSFDIASVMDREKKTKPPLFFLLEGVEKPGNLGAILRTADAVGADGVILVDSTIDPYNPNVVRSSLGALFSVPVFSLSFEAFLAFAKKAGIEVVAAFPGAKESYAVKDYRGPVALAFGSEDKGLQPRWRPVAAPVAIPMLGICDSLNLSVSVAVLAYEALRQRSLPCE